MINWLVERGTKVLVLRAFFCSHLTGCDGIAQDGGRLTSLQRFDATWCVTAVAGQNNLRNVDAIDVVLDSGCGMSAARTNRHQAGGMTNRRFCVRGFEAHLADVAAGGGRRLLVAEAAMRSRRERVAFLLRT